MRGRSRRISAAERLARAGASPTRSGPEGSSRNGSRLGRGQPLTLCRRGSDRSRRPPTLARILPESGYWAASKCDVPRLVSYNPAVDYSRRGPEWPDEGKAMKKTMIMLAASTVLAACAAEEADTTTGQTVGQWRIDVNQAAGPGCFAVRNFVNPNSEVQMGINATSTPPSGYLVDLRAGLRGHPARAVDPGDLHRRRPGVQGHLHRAGHRRLRRRHRPGGQCRLHLQPRRPGPAHHHLRGRPPGDRPARGRRPRHRRPARLPGRRSSRSAGRARSRPPLLLPGAAHRLGRPSPRHRNAA